MKVDSFIVTLLLWLWTMQKCDCFCGIILRNHDVARRPINRSSHRIPAASTTTRLSQMQHPLQPSNKSHHHHGCLASTSTANVDDDSSSALLVKGDELDDRIRFEFKIGSHGLYGEDGVRFLYPGLAAVLKYPPDAQEAWINGIVSARDHFAHDHNLPTISQRRQYHSRKDEVPVGLKDVIRDEFRIGSHGLYGEDGVRFMYPGLAAVLDYPPHAQEAWILDVAAARDHYALDHDLPTPRHLQVTASRPEAIFSTTTRRRSIATVQKRGLTTFQRFQKIFNSASSGSKKDDGGLTIRQRMAKMGLSVAISYGFVSNLAGCSSIVLTWYIFSKKTGLSPLAPGQWKPFLAVYAGFYIFHNIVRPARFALSVALSPKIDSYLAWLQRRWRVANKGLAILIVMFSLNIVLCTGSMIAGILLASQMARVPIFPVR